MQTNLTDEPIRIFISYARKDRRWFDEDDKHGLIPHLIDCFKKQKVIFWYDKEILPSEVFKPLIQQEINRAHICILMVSQFFINSDFIEEHELPCIKEREQQGKLRVLPILLEPCTWKDDEYLSERNMLPGQPTPLIKYIDRDAEWAEVKLEIYEGIKILVKRIRAELTREFEIQQRVRQQLEETENQRVAEEARLKAEANRLAAEAQQQEEARLVAEAEAARKEQERWEYATLADTEESYATYLAESTLLTHKEDAQARMMAWQAIRVRAEEEAKAQREIEVAAERARQQERLIEEQLWTRAVKADTEKSYATYLAKSTLRTHQEAAQTRTTELQAIRVREKEEAARIRREQKLAAELARQRAVQQELELWTHAAQADTEDSYTTYLAASTLLTHKEEAQARAIALQAKRVRAEEEAKAQREKEAAAERARQQELQSEGQLWDRTVKADTEKSYAAYLAKSTLRTHQEAAQTRLLELQALRIRAEEEAAHLQSEQAAAAERARQQEEQDEQVFWALVAEVDTEDSYTTYLADSTLLTHKEEAQARVMALQAIRVRAEEEAARIQREKEAVEERARQQERLIEEQLWDRTVKADTEKSYAAYLAKSTLLTHQEAAQTRTMELQAIRVREKEEAAGTSDVLGLRVAELERQILALEEGEPDILVPVKPTIKLLAMVNGITVSGAKVSDGKTTWEMPIILTLESGGKYHFSSTYTNAAGKAHTSALEITATWTGEQLCRVTLEKVPSASAPTVIPAQLGLEWVTIPAGDFLYGDDNVRKRLPAYQIMKYPVTVAQYRQFCTATGRQMPDAPEWGWQDTHPVVNVTWDDAAAFAAYAGGALPTEEEWEKAARGTDGRAYPWGNNWYAGNAHCSRKEAGDAKQTAPVGRSLAGASPYGCRDLAGNVWEWCDSWYDSDKKMRVLRGGSWYNDFPGSFRASYRGGRNPSGRYFSNGFRCVLRSPDTGNLTGGIIPAQLGIDWVTIPAGDFLYGEDKERKYLPAYQMMKYPVTVAQYRQFCTETGRQMPSAPPWGWQDTHPMVYVIWFDAAAFAAYAGLALPSDEEWEKAARGTDGRLYPWGNAWRVANMHRSRKERGDAKQTAPVGSYPAGASPYGCLDLAGNVWEWCDSWYDSDKKTRVLRGGCWGDYVPDAFRATYRFDRTPMSRSYQGGFRCVLRSPGP